MGNSDHPSTVFPSPNFTIASSGDVTIRSNSRTALAQMLGDRLGARAHMKFFVDVADVRVHSGVGNFHLVGNFLVKKSLGQKVEHLGFTRRQRLGFIAGGGWSFL